MMSLSIGARGAARRTVATFLALAAGAVLAGGCGPLTIGSSTDGDAGTAASGGGKTGGGTGGGSSGTGAGIVDDGGGTIAGDPCTAGTDYDTVEKALSERTTMFLGPDVQNLAPVQNRLYWYDTTNYAPVLDGYTDGGGSALAYTFTVGDSIDDANWRASASLIVTAQPTGSGVRYYAYDPTEASKEVGHIDVSAPDGASYWAYAVDAGTVYLVMLDAHGDNALVKWVPASGAATTTVTTLESAGATVGEFWDFDVSGNTMVFIESGRIWTLDLATNKATWLMNTTEVSSDGSIDFESDGVMFTTDTDLLFFDYSSSSLVNVSDKINHKGHSSGACSGGASNYATDFTRWGNAVVYTGESSGVFAYDMVEDVIAPVLLPPTSGPSTVQYRYPVALADGKLFVTALTSSDGSTGADGPTVALDLASLLQ